MEDKKYEFTGEAQILPFGKILHRIRAIKSFGDVKAGDLGGWIQEEDNLSQNGNAWVSDSAYVYDRARIAGDALISEHARVFGDARVLGRASVSGRAWIFGRAFVYGEAQISGAVKVFDYAIVCGNALLNYLTRVCGDACIADDSAQEELTVSTCGNSSNAMKQRTAEEAYILQIHRQDSDEACEKITRMYGQRFKELDSCFADEDNQIHVDRIIEAAISEPDSNTGQLYQLLWDYMDLLSVREDSRNYLLP